MKKTLWLDLGNTRLKYWLTQNNEVLKQGAQQHLQAPAELLMGLTDRFAGFKPDFIGVSSVLGTKINSTITNSLAHLNIPFELVKVDDQFPIMRSKYDAKQLGVDRWLQMLAVATDYKKMCVVGCGTALTIDIIEHGQHLGGYILPSIYLQREALQSGTRQISIPEQMFEHVDVGMNTSDAVHKGILLSLVGAIEHVLAKHPEHKLVMTGGDAQMISKHLSQKAYIASDLVLKGLQTYFEHKNAI